MDVFRRKVQLLLLNIALLVLAQARKLCEFAEIYPSKGQTCVKQGEDPTTMLSDAFSLSEITTMLPCPPNMVYGDPACVPTCEDPVSKTGCNPAVTTSILTCVCTDGFLWNGSHCVTDDQCGCYLPSVGIIKEGEYYVNANCTTHYRCTNNTLVIDKAYKCNESATCAVKDGVRRCYCNEGFSGDGSKCAHRDCYDHFMSGSTTDGIYTVYPTGWQETGFQVYCEMSTDGGGWTVFQRRTTLAEIFYNPWFYYKTGFGYLIGDHWLGNDKLHSLTSQTTYQLRVDVKHQLGSDTWYYALYSYFSISDEADKYRLSLGTYSGTAGDDMSQEEGNQFSTPNQDNDGEEYFHCANYHRGGWWYSTQRYSSTLACPAVVCSNANLNGLITHYYDIHGTFWSTLTQSGSCSMSQTKMRIRPIDYL